MEGGDRGRTSPAPPTCARLANISSLKEGEEFMLEGSHRDEGKGTQVHHTRERSPCWDKPSCQKAIPLGMQGWGQHSRCSTMLPLKGFVAVVAVVVCVCVCFKARPQGKRF
jgi:hypothetical protein